MIQLQLLHTWLQLQLRRRPKFCTSRQTPNLASGLTHLHLQHQEVHPGFKAPPRHFSLLSLNPAIRMGSTVSSINSSNSNSNCSLLVNLDLKLHLTQLVARMLREVQQ